MTIIQHRKDTEANWFNVNPILTDGEIGVEIDTRRIKMGDGVTHWQDLPYMVKTKISELTDDVGLAKLIDIPHKTSELQNDSDFQNETQVRELIGEIAINGYTHTQAIASDTWEINHNLNKKPQVTVVDTNDVIVHTEVFYEDNNTCIVKFLGATTGYAYCI